MMMLKWFFHALILGFSSQAIAGSALDGKDKDPKQAGGTSFLRHRSLQSTVPFTAELKLSVASGDRKGEGDEYDEAKQAFQDWFEDETKKYHPSFESASCTVSEATWDPDATDAFPHKVKMYCNAEFGSGGTAPTSNEMIRTASENYSFSNFVGLYLMPQASADSIFRKTRRSAYTMTAIISATTPGDSVPAPTMGPPAPTMSEPTPTSMSEPSPTSMSEPTPTMSPPTPDDMGGPTHSDMGGSTPTMAMNQPTPTMGQPSPTASPPTSSGTGGTGQPSEYTVPFSVNLRIGVSRNDSKPTPEQLNEVNSAFMNWFDDQSSIYYPDFTGSSCSIADEETTWDPNAADGFQHKIKMSCEAQFETSDPNSVPTSNEMMRKASESYTYQAFIRDYVMGSVSAESPYNYVRNASYTMVAVLTPTAPRPTPSPPTGPSPTAAAGNPTMLPPTTLSFNSPTAGGAGSTVAQVAVLEWKLGKPTGSTDTPSPPTDDDYDEFLRLYNKFVTDTLTTYYNADPETPTFTSADTTYMLKDFTTNSEPSTVLRVDSRLNFSLASGQANPPMWQWVLALRNEGLASFRNNYLATSTVPDFAFKNPSSLSWKVIEDP